jgi:Ring finger domain
MDKIFAPKDVPTIAVPLTVDSGDADRKAPSAASCSCPICTRKPDPLVSSVLASLVQRAVGLVCAHSHRQHVSCDHHLNASEDSVLYAHPEESYPDVPRTITPASSVNHSQWSVFPDESLIDIAVSSLPIPTAAGPDSTQTYAPPSLHTRASSLRDTIQPLSVPGSGSSSTRIFDHSLSSQSSLSVPASFEAFLTPRAAPLPPASPTSTTTTPNNMSMTWVPGLPFLRRPEETNKDMFPCSICLEEELYDDAVIIQACGHMFGRECMRNYILAKLDERRFPIPCPCCSVDETGVTQGSTSAFSPHSYSFVGLLVSQWSPAELLHKSIYLTPIMPDGINSSSRLMPCSLSATDVTNLTPLTVGKLSKRRGRRESIA